MKGWKTWTGAALVAASAALDFLGLGAYAEIALYAGNALGLVGIGHKIEKAGE